MPAKRCSGCSLDYPNEYAYRECLQCGQDTWVGANIEPMPAGDLAALKDRLRAEDREIAKRPDGLGEQWLIAYNDPKAQNPNGERRTEVFFATAYNVDEAKRQMDVCKSVHGVDCHVRTFVARARPPKDDQPVAAGTRKT